MAIDSLRVRVGNTEASSFVELTQMALNVMNLSKLHTITPMLDMVTRETDQKTMWHRSFYAFVNQNKWFLETYKEFIRTTIYPLFNEPIAYQTVPTFRVHLPGNLSVGEVHKDSDYGHSVDEVNFWVPLTLTGEQNSVKLELSNGAVKSLTAAVGEMWIFDGANLKHWNVLNTSDETRVSFDFRVIPMSKYTHNPHSSINTAQSFTIGDYFSQYPPSSNI
jgi:hypothetical protein